MRIKFGNQYKIKWLDAWGEASWTDDKELDKLIKEHTPENQTLYFIKQTPDFYIFTSGKPTKGQAYIDIHAIPRGWVSSMTSIR